jgi:glycerol uptake facilitator-like aquaporin
MTGETCVNPALGVAHQIFSSIIDPEHARAEMILMLIFPALIGGAIAGYVMRQYYEPMYLYCKFKH